MTIQKILQDPRRVVPDITEKDIYTKVIIVDLLRKDRLDHIYRYIALKNTDLDINILYGGLCTENDPNIWENSGSKSLLNILLWVSFHFWSSTTFKLDIYIIDNKQDLMSVIKDDKYKIDKIILDYGNKLLKD